MNLQADEFDNCTYEDIDNLFNSLDSLGNHVNFDQLGGQDPEPDVFKLVYENESIYSSFKYKRIILKYEISNNQYKSFVEAEDGTDEFINSIFDKHINHLNKTYMVRIVMQHRLFETPISTNFINKEQFVPDIIKTRLYNAIQSKSNQGK
jgi:hypothetical protein